MKRIDMTNVKEAGDFSRPEPGAYICIITKVEDVPAKEYLKVFYDIAQGEFKGYYSDMRENHPDWIWAGAYTKSYKPTAQPMFKRFCSAVSKSNGAYVFDAGAVNADENTLIGKLIGLVFQEEEYYGNDGSKKTRLIVSREFPVDQIDKQKTPKKKELPEDTASVTDGFVNAVSGPAGLEALPFE
jgi:hypothetical protein